MQFTFLFNSNTITQDISPSTSVPNLKLLLSSLLSIPPSSILLFPPSSSTQIPDSAVLSSLPNPTLEIRLKLSKTLTYLESLGLDESLPSRDSNPLQEAIEACKRGSLRDLSRIAEIYEQTNPGEINLMHQSHENLWTTLHYSCYYGRDDILKYLIGRLVNVNSVTADEWTPLQLASYRCHINCVKALVAYQNLQINKMTRYRGTALHLACEVENLEIVEILLKNGAIVTLADCNNDTAFDKTNNDRILKLMAAAMGTGNKTSQAPVSRVDEVYMCSVLDIHGRPVVLHLDSNLMQLKRYKNIAEYSQKAEPENVLFLRNVQNIRTEFIKMTQEYYFIVESDLSEDRYYSNNKELSNEWANELKTAANFSLTQAQVRERTATRIERPVKKQEVENDTTKSSEEVVNFDSFELLEELGQGSYGVVYKAKKKSSSEIFALKSLSKANLKKQRMLKYAISECKIMKILKHPFVLMMHYAFQTTQSLFMVLDYCPNGDLLGLIEKFGKLTEELAVFYVAETVLAIGYLHELDIVYRDLKPANILIDKDFHVKLADFGLAKEDITNTPAMTMAGSPAYLPPEIVECRGASPASDIYGIGVLMYELITGNLPYYNPDIEQLFDSIVKDSLMIPSFVSKEVSDFIRSLMEKDPMKRLTISQMKEHKVFRNINWKDLMEKSVSAPRIN